MLNNCTTLLLVFILLIACKQESPKPKNAIDTINKLDSVEKQTAFLMDIFNKDQQVRKDEKSAIQNFGMNSAQHQQTIEAIMDTDEQNLKLVESYLMKHGHPNRKAHGFEAADTPWLVIHHAVAGTGVRRKYFPIFYKAFQDGNIYGKSLTMYLNRMYNLKFNGRINWNRPYSEQEELDTLIKSLNLASLTR